ncbi:hypothetical protein BUALT_Bualt17G0018600 [Buddleja alternifolia]|uniref:REF/SRPP-like protein n=1 Tax=Buddleja alternifolia TaxID=168488 RepID=A0AAV6W639_9LAMI|nr:hypothetical protein BUALT_Bualt17G0018600 [Buddleja alternifolia]
MATSQAEKNKEVELKHLGFVRILTINAVVLVSNIYDYAKESSGSLKSTFGSVENAVTAVVGPVYYRVKGLPTCLLVFLDNKVDEATYKFDECAPPAVKNVVSKAKLVVNNASQIAQDLAEEAKVAGPVAAISHAGTNSKHFAVSQVAMLWYKANKYPALHCVTEMAIPTVAHLSEKYNHLVKKMAAKGYNLFKYVPLVPVEEMSKAYEQAEAAEGKKAEAEAAAGKKADTSSSSESESDKE